MERHASAESGLISLAPGQQIVVTSGCGGGRGSLSRPGAPALPSSAEKSGYVQLEKKRVYSIILYYQVLQVWCTNRTITKPDRRKVDRKPPLGHSPLKLRSSTFPA
eukprot:4884562-Prymnesium_polylepis.1